MSGKVRGASAAAVLVVLVVVFALPHQDPTSVDLTAILQNPSRTHLLGTDDLGRDVWALLAAGFWRTCTVVIVTCAISVLLGVPAGLAAGFLGRATDSAISSVTDLVLVVPSLVVALIVTSVVGLSPVSAGVVLGLYGAGTYALQTRSLTRVVRDRDHVRAEVLLGTPRPVILARQILPEISSPLLHYLGSTAAGAILSFAGLAFLGLGVDATVPDWGTMLYQYRSQTGHPTLLLAPSLAIAILAGAIHMVCDAPGRKR